MLVIKFYVSPKSPTSKKNVTSLHFMQKHLKYNLFVNALFIYRYILVISGKIIRYLLLFHRHKLMLHVIFIGLFTTNFN